MSSSEKTSDLKNVHTVSSDDGGFGESTEINPLNFKQTKRHLLPRHIQLIAISGAIGTGLFVSTPDKTDIQHLLTGPDWYWFCVAQGGTPRFTPRLQCLWRSRLHCLQLNGRDGVVPTYRWIIR